MEMIRNKGKKKHQFSVNKISRKADFVLNVIFFLWALACVLLWPLAGEIAAMLCGGGLVVAIRILSAHFRWNLPRAHE